MNLTAQQRNWLYGIACALLAVAVTYKLIDPAHAPLWLDLAANILGIGGTGTAAVVLKTQRADGTVE